MYRIHLPITVPEGNGILLTNNQSVAQPSEQQPEPAGTLIIGDYLANITQKEDHLYILSVPGVSSQEEAHSLLDKIHAGLMMTAVTVPNPYFEHQGLVCPWEHCVELMPVTEETTRVPCPVFGHTCPGGPPAVSTCGRTIRDIPRNRFANNSQ